MASDGASASAERPPSASVTSSSASTVSFSIARKSHQGQGSAGGSVRKRENHAGFGGGRVQDGESDKDLVFSLEGGNIHSSKPVAKKKEYVVPLIRKVVWRGVSDSGKKGGEEGEEGGVGVDSEKSQAELVLDKEAAQAIIADLENYKAESEGANDGPVIPLLLQNKPPVVADAAENSELPDLSMRPEQSTAEDYEEMPIVEFGKAMLRGMGWSEGNALGKTNKGMVAPVEFIPRMGKLGLGAAPKPQAPPDKKRPRKPGDTDKKVVQGPYIDTDGRVKHTRLIGEEIPEQPIKGYRAGNFARVLQGPHVGLCGKIVSADEDTSRIALRLAVNGQVIDFSQHHLELISKEEYMKPPDRQPSSKEYGLLKKKGVSEQSLPSPNRGSYSDKPCSSKTLPYSSTDNSETTSRESKKRQADPPADMNCERSKRSKYREDAHGSGRSGKSGSKLSAEGSSQHESSRERLWVAPNLRVRIIDTKFKGGKYYNNKVEILDVVSGDQCACRTDEGRHLEGVRQSMLETVVPKSLNAAVMIVGGKKHKGQVARLLDRDSKNSKATVEVVYNSKVLTVDYDNICEYTGVVED